MGGWRVGKKFGVGGPKISLHRDVMADKGNKLDTWMGIIFLILVLPLPSCSTVQFYTQALQGQTEIMRKARPVSEVMADPKTKPLLKEKLTAVADMLVFAQSDLALPAKGQYDRYTNLQRPYVVWVIYAAPKYSIEAKTWCYPLIGKVKYRGFFDEKVAEKELAKLRAEGFDAFIGGVEAYSTLGYLRDPLLNTFIGREDADLAELVFHELTHQRVYLSGDTDFNEALATAVGQEGAKRWLKARGKTEELAQYLKEGRVEKDFIAEVLQTRTELKDFYATPGLDENALAAGKKAAFDRLRQRINELNRRYGGSLRLDRWFLKPVNNARLNTLATYYDLVPGFEALLRQHHGDIDAFLHALEGMKSMDRHERRRRIKVLATP